MGGASMLTRALGAKTQHHDACELTYPFNSRITAAACARPVAARRQRQEPHCRKVRHHAPMRADASPFLDKQNTAEKIWLHVELVEAVHVARQIDVAEMYSVHGSSLEIVAALTL